MKLRQIAFWAVLICAAVTFQSQAAINFTDGFEGASLDPFWTVSASNGLVTFPSTAQVHGGSQSVQFDSIAAGMFKEIDRSHNFSTEIYGTFSVRMYDAGFGSAITWICTASAIARNYLQRIPAVMSARRASPRGTETWLQG